MPTSSAPPVRARIRLAMRSRSVPQALSHLTPRLYESLVTRGWRYGLNLLHLCFPEAEHNEGAWGMRLHLPMQFLNGAVARASRIGSPVLGDAA